MLSTPIHHSFLTVIVRAPTLGVLALPVPMPVQELTKHQTSVLEHIREFQQKKGYSPSLSDLASAFNVKSKNAVAKVVNVLERARKITKDPKGRIKIIDKIASAIDSMPFSLPLFGPIAAGFAAPVEEQAEETITIENYLVRDKASTFLLRVKGDSMIDAGIHEGDLVVVERGKEPRNGDIVVGILDGEFTLKRLMKEKDGKYVLKAENTRYPKLYARDELQTAGVVRGSIRRY